MYPNEHLVADYRTDLQFVEMPNHMARAAAEASLDMLYADVLPLAPSVRQVDARRIVRLDSNEAVLN